MKGVLVGYYVETSGFITIPAGRVDELDAAIRADVDGRTFYTDSSVGVGMDVGELIAHVIDDCISENSNGGDWDTLPDGSLRVGNSGYGKVGLADPLRALLTFLAGYGAAGSYERVGEEGERWRLTAGGGEVREESERIVLYGADIDTTAWIAQRGRPGGLDQVAVVPNREAGLTLIASWRESDCRRRVECVKPLIPAGFDAEGLMNALLALEAGNEEWRVEPVAPPAGAPILTEQMCDFSEDVAGGQSSDGGVLMNPVGGDR